MRSKLFTLAIFVTISTVIKTQVPPDVNDTTVDTIATDLLPDNTTLKDCYDKLDFTGKTKSMFNIGPKVYIRYSANKSNYQYFIYDTDTENVGEKTDHSPLFPGSSAYVVFAAAIIGETELNKGNNFMITIEMTGDLLDVQSYFTYRSVDGKQWQKITNAGDLPNFKLKTHGELRNYLLDGFWPIETSNQKIEGFGFYTPERIFVISYKRLVGDRVEIKYKKVVVDVSGAHIQNDWIVLMESSNLLLYYYFSSLFEMSGKFYTNYIVVIKDRQQLKVSYITPFDLIKNGDQLSYSVSGGEEILQRFFNCVIPELQYSRNPNQQTFRPNPYTPPNPLNPYTTKSPSKMSNILIIIGLFVCIAIACLLITGVVYWTFKKRKQEPQEAKEVEEVNIETGNSKEEVAADEGVSDEGKRESSQISSASAVSKVSRRSYALKPESKAE